MLEVGFVWLLIIFLSFKNNSKIILRNVGLSNSVSNKLKFFNWDSMFLRLVVYVKYW